MRPRTKFRNCESSGFLDSGSSHNGPHVCEPSPLMPPLLLGVLWMALLTHLRNRSTFDLSARGRLAACEYCSNALSV
jgi:hypothetical protein